MKRVVTESDSRGFWETADSVCLTYGNRCLAAADAADELVRTKLEMGCAGRLSCADAFFGRLRTCDFFLRHGRVEADGCLQDGTGPGGCAAVFSGDRRVEIDGAACRLVDEAIPLN